MSRVSSPIFVGRKAELERITDALDQATLGESGVLLVAGEAGVGKTRLVQEAVAVARRRGTTCLVGGCLDHGGAGDAFAPLREALRGLLVNAGPEEAQALLGDGAVELMALLPGRRTTGTQTDLVGLAEDSGQARLFEAWLELFRHLASPAAPLFVVEDIHWADPSTLDLLRFLTRNHQHARFVVLATFRSDELHRRHPLVPVLAELQRTLAVTRIDVPRLERDETAALVVAIRGSPIDPNVAGLIHTRSDGLPFYAEELLAVASDTERAPDSLREVLRARIVALSDETQEMLRSAAVAGAQFSTAVLARAIERDAADLEPALREAVEKHVLVPVDDHAEERYAFRHMLVHEAVYDDLLPGERVRFHARLAEAIAATAAPTDPTAAAALAHHWYAAHDLPRALEAARLAGVAAEDVHAFTDAYRHYERVLELWDHVPDAERRLGLDRIAVMEMAARNAVDADPHRAASLIDEAIRLGTGSVGRERLGLLKEQLGRYVYPAGDGFAAIEACREAVELVPAEPPTVSRARVLASLGQILMVTVQNEEAKPICEEAVTTARAVGARQIEAHALCSLGAATTYLGDLETGMEHIRASLLVALEIGSVEDVARARLEIVDSLANVGRFAEAGEAALDAFVYAEANGLARGMGVITLCEAGLAFFRGGNWEAARAAYVRAERYHVVGIAQIMLEQRAAMLDVASGMFDEAVARLRRAEGLIERAVEAQLIAPMAEAQAELGLWQGRPADARSAVDAAFARLPAGRPAYVSRLGPLFFLAVRAEADLAILARARRAGDEASDSRRRAESHLAVLRAVRDAAAARLPNFAPQANAWYAASEAELGRLDGSNEPGAWVAAERAFGATDMPYPQAYAQWRLAEAILASHGSRSAAADSLRHARAACARLGAHPLLAEIETLAGRARMDLDPTSKDATDASVRVEVGGLTSRELEVIRLVAAGRTNRQIAAALFITEGTAGTHVSNILSKLGVRGRTEAAAIAHRLGLLDPAQGSPTEPRAS